MKVTYVYHSLELWETPLVVPSLVDLLNRNSWSFCLTSVLATAPVRPGDAQTEIMSILGLIQMIFLDTIKPRHSWQSSTNTLWLAWYSHCKQKECLFPEFGFISRSEKWLYYCHSQTQQDQPQTIASLSYTFTHTLLSKAPVQMPL